MSDLGFIVEKFNRDLDFTVHVWKLGEAFPEPLWRAPRISRLSKEGKKMLPHIPSTFLAANNKLYMGMTDGTILKLNIKTGAVEGSYGQRKAWEHRTFGPVKIRELVLFNGIVYDASIAGLFATESGKEIDDRRIESAEIYDGRLLIVPHGPSINKPETTASSYLNRSQTTSGGVPPGLLDYFQAQRESKAGDLIDAISKETIIKQVEPFDGSGRAPGKHKIADNKVYMKHGNYPHERITIRDFQTGDIIKRRFLDIGSEGFIEHDGAVYDLRSWDDNNRIRSTRIMRSDEINSACSMSLFDKPHYNNEEFDGFASAGKDGLLISLYNNKRDTSRIISHLRPNSSLWEYDGRLILSKI